MGSSCLYERIKHGNILKKYDDRWGSMKIDGNNLIDHLGYLCFYDALLLSLYEIIIISCSCSDALFS